MERKFCSKCGALLGECTCNVGINPTPVPEPKPEPKPEPTPELSGRESTEFGRGKKEQDEANRSGRYYIKRFDKIALIQGEQVVRKYHIGEFAKRLGAAGKGSASIIITNKRVISKQDRFLVIFK